MKINIKNKMKRNMKRNTNNIKIVVLMILIPLVFSILTGCEKKETNNSGKNPAKPVEVSKAQNQELVLFMDYSGSVEPYKIARMASPAEGPIIRCAVREGDNVRTGQFLARVGRSASAEAGLDAAQEELNRLKSEFQRVQQLVESGSLPGEQLDMARANLKNAEAKVASMKTGASDYTITAPWSGVVSKVWISEGNYVSPRQPLVEIYDTTSLVVRFSVPEREVSQINVGQQIVSTFDALPGKTRPAVVTRIYPELERATGSVTVEARLDNNSGFLSGMFARVKAPVKSLESAIVIPVEALITLPNGNTVVFVAKNGKAERRNVEIEMEAQDKVAIASGIEAGEMVVIRGQSKLGDGAAIKIPGKKTAGKKTEPRKTQEKILTGQEAKTQ